MGGYYKVEADLQVPLWQVALLGQKLQKSALFSPESPGPETVEDVLTEVFENDDLEYKQDGDRLKITGCASGEMRYSDMTTLLHELKDYVTGVLDLQEDDGDWVRCRYHGNGTMAEHQGEVIFPTDKEDA